MSLPATTCAATHIAPVPPEAVVLRGSSPGRHHDLFLSKRTPDEIRAFHSARLQPLAGDAGSAHEAASRSVFGYQQVVDILSTHHGDLMLADDLRVTIRWKPDSNGQSQYAGDFLRVLLAIAHVQRREVALGALCKEYGCLQNAYFQCVPDPRPPGQRADTDKVILSRAHASPGAQQAQALKQSAARLG